MDKLRQLLQRGRNGNALLFCGAGLTADCLNFDDDAPLGVTIQLLQLLNEQLKASGKRSGFNDIRNAAKQFKTDLGNHYLMTLLKDRFRLSKVSASIADILKYPWSAVYTTNYDDGIEIGLRNAGRKFVPINNLDEPSDPPSGTAIIHLHGRAEVWDDRNFEQSCVLDVDSYRRLSGVRNWLDRLRFDIERAELVVFIGFSAADFHLDQVFFNASGLREKAFFINRPSSDPNPDERAIQEEFGLPLYIGRTGLVDIIGEALRQEAFLEPKLASFSRYQLPRPANAVPPVQDIEDLFIWGRVVPEHVKRDYDVSKSDYHVLRQEAQAVQRKLNTDSNVALLQGDICDGKSLIVLGLMNGFSGERPVFELRHPYADLLEEASAISNVYPNAVFVVENCFTLRDDHLLGLARQIAASNGKLILTARNISTEGESGKLKGLRSVSSFSEVTIGRLLPSEVDALTALIDQIAGWRNLPALTLTDRRRFVEKECGGSVPGVLLRLLNSDYVRKKYREEYNRTNYLDPRDRQMVVAALLVANLGLDPQASFLSDVFERDFASVLTRISTASGGLRLVRVVGGFVSTIPSIGARNLLRNVVETRDVVNTIIFILERMAETARRTDFSQHVFSQLMRYSILSSIVTDKDEINRFFDHISKIGQFRDMPLFWLQWHMSMSAQLQWVKAEEYLEMGYITAAAFEKRRNEEYNLKQLDDRKAKFLAGRAIGLMRTGVELFRDLKQALDIVGRLMRTADLTHHPYETLVDITKAFKLGGDTLIREQSVLLARQLKAVTDQARRRLNMLPEGYQRTHAIEAIKQVEAAAIV